MKQDSDVSKRVVWYGLSISMHSPGYILICSHHEPEEFCFALVQVRCCLCAKIHLQWCGQYGISIIRRNKATHIHRNIYGNVNMCNICIMWMNGTHRNAFQNNSPVFLYISYCSSKPFNVKIKICSHIVITISNRRVCYVMETRLQWEPRWSESIQIESYIAKAHKHFVFLSYIQYIVEMLSNLFGLLTVALQWLLPGMGNNEQESIIAIATLNVLILSLKFETKLHTVCFCLS